MSSDESGPTESTTGNTLIAKAKSEPSKNRKQRRFEASLARRRFKQYTDTTVYYWVNRFIREMKENKSVQEKVLSGKLDKYLPQDSSVDDAEE